MSLSLAAALLLQLNCSSESDPDGAPPGGESCAAGLSVCGQACVDVRSDPSHCGGCDRACSSDLACSLGTCSSTCAAGLVACSAACVAIASDARHCGRCDNACAADQTCSNGICSARPSGGAGTTGMGTAGTTGSAGSSNTAGGGGASGAGDGYQVGTMCFPACASAVTDEDSDGYGYEMGRSCVVAGSVPTQGATRCAPPPVTPVDIPPGDGFSIAGTCHPRCASAASDVDPTGAMDGWGYEMGKSCIVAGSAPAMQGVPCVPPAATSGDGYLVSDLCVPACMHAALADAQGYGYEAQQTCVVPGSMAAIQNARCMLMPRQLPPPGTGFQHGETCFPRCGANAQDVTADGFGWDVNRTCVVPSSTAAVQGVPCVPPAADVTGECPRTLACPAVAGTTLQCGCTWIDGLAERKREIMAVTGASRYFLASAMMETATLRADYTLGDGKTNDAFNAGIAKQNWGMMRRCHPAWNALGEGQFATSTAMNMSLMLDVQVYNECRTMFGANWWSGHRMGHNNLGSTSVDVQRFKAAMDWTDMMLVGHLEDDVRFWVAIPAI